jgi:enoyl-CoA hydratase/carnithine racemase
MTVEREESEVAGPEEAYTAFAVACKGHVATVELRGTGTGNGLGRAFWIELPRVVRDLERHEGVRVVVLRGAGDTFTVGLDLRWYVPHLRHAMRRGGALAASRAELLEQNRLMQESVSALAQCRKPVVAAIHGECIGGGLDIATACDLRFAAADAVFSVREVRLGIVADLGVLQRLPRIVGEGHTRELALRGSDIDAKRAFEIGLVNQVYTSASALFAGAHAVAEEIAANPPRAVAGTKRVLVETDGLRIDEALRYAALWNTAFLPSDDFREAIAALGEGRPPEFTGR